MSVETRTRERPRTENNNRLLTGHILSDDPLRPDRTQIRYSLGSRELVLSLPKSPLNGDNKPHAYFHRGRGLEGVTPDIAQGNNQGITEEEFVVDFASGPRDAEFTLSPDTHMTINLRGVNDRIRAHVRLHASPDKAVVISAEGERNRWLKVKSGKAAELHAYGNDPGTDDDLRVVIDQTGRVGQLHLYDHAAAHTPQTGNLESFIDELHVYGDAFLNDTKLAPGNTLADMPLLIARGREGSRRTVIADGFHPGTPPTRHKYDDPHEHTLAELAEEQEKRRKEREKVLQVRYDWVVQQERREPGSRLLPDWYYTGRREKKQPIRDFLSRIRSRRFASSESKETRGDRHISLKPVESENRFLGTIVRDAFYKAKIDFNDYDMQVALALAMVVKGTDTSPSVGKKAYILSDEALRFIVERDNHDGLKKALDVFVEGFDANAHMGINAKRHVSEIAQKTDIGWFVIDELDTLIMLDSEGHAAQARVQEAVVPETVFVAPADASALLSDTRELVGAGVMGTSGF